MKSQVWNCMYIAKFMVTGSVIPAILSYYIPWLINILYVYCAFFGKFRLGDKQNGEIVHSTCDHLSLLFL